MTIKKEIQEILKKGDGIVRINNISSLHYNTKNALNENADNLVLTFKYIGGVKGGTETEIEARTYEGILAEIETATKKYFKDCANELNKNLKNGYR